MATYTHFSVTIDGRRYTGDWLLDGKEISVGSAYGSARVPLGRAKPENLAVRLLREIVAKRDARLPQPG
jgi:hypothetical protein